MAGEAKDVAVDTPSPDDPRRIRLEEWGRVLRRTCKSKFFKQVTEESITDVFAASLAEGIAPQEYINLGNENTKTALMFAAQLNRSISVVNILIESGADVNQATNRGHTPIFYAASKGRDEVALLLLEKGARCRVRNVNGATPFTAGDGRLSIGVLQAIRQRERDEEGDYVDYTNDPVAIEAQRVHALTCRGCQRALQSRDTDGYLTGSTGSLNNEFVPVECARPEGVRSMSTALLLEDDRSKSLKDLLFDILSGIKCGGHKSHAEMDEIVNKIAKHIIHACFRAFTTAGHNRKAENQVFRENISEVCDLAFSDVSACLARGVALLLASNRKYLNTQLLNPYQISGRKAINVHNMVTGAFTAALAKHGDWLMRLGIRRSLSVLDTDVFLAVLPAVDHVEATKTVECSCISNITEQGTQDMLQKAVQTASTGKGMIATRLYYQLLEEMNDLTESREMDMDIWRTGAEQLMEIVVRNGQFHALELLLGENLPSELHELRVRAIDSLLDFVEDNECRNAHWHFKTALNLSGKWGLTALSTPHNDNPDLNGPNRIARRLEVAILYDMLNRNEIDRARMYAEDFPHLQSILNERISSMNPDTCAPELNGQRDFLKLELPEDNLFWIDSEEGLQSMIETILSTIENAASPVDIGLDTEWRDPRPQCSIVQIALPDTVFVVDTFLPIIQDREGAYSSAVTSALRQIFALPLETNNFVKLYGFGFKGDLGHLTLLGIPQEEMTASTIDLQDICQSYLSLQSSPSLSQACFTILSSPVDKREQCSNWERRPLSASQLHYAALDAHVLITLAGALL